jgi:hypothetical protein
MTHDPEMNGFDQMARSIRTRTADILTRRGLLPRFKRWRLSRDPDTGMVVLFGILNNRYIAAHSSTAFRNYFDTTLLHDLANELRVQVVSCSSDGLRYAFILDRGSLGRLPTHIDIPLVEYGTPQVRVVYSEIPPSVAVLPVDTLPVEDHMLIRQGVGAFLKVFDDLHLKGSALSAADLQSAPDFVMIDEREFNNQVAELEALQRRRKQTGRLLDTSVG